MTSWKVPSSFRDPSGFVFCREGRLYRQVNPAYREDYDRLMQSGLYEALAGSGLLIAHREVDIPPCDTRQCYKVLEPQPVPFISYPYEWCFSQLKDAALTTVEIQNRALEYRMTLKDSSAYNIQFVEGRPRLIDTLSFETYREGRPWAAYRQFCQHFLAPLSLMAYRDVRLNQLLKSHLDGIPLDLASSLLPFRARLRPGLLTHIHAHAKSQKYFSSGKVPARTLKVSRAALGGLLESLKTAIENLNCKQVKTAWSDYYGECSYSEAALQRKATLVGRLLERIRPRTVWDMGGNIGFFSRLASEKGASVVCFDHDPAAVEKSYLANLAKGETRVLPLILDLTNPSPSLGWHGRERLSLLERGPVDAVLALALIHHLAISNNLPLDQIAAFFRDICQTLIAEFVPKSDPQTQRLLVSREDIFPGYTQQGFEGEFGKHFRIESREEIDDSKRVLYCMTRL